MKKSFNSNNIELYLHCGQCLKEWKKGSTLSPRDYARTQVGWTKKGLQVWCNRHNCNIIHIDFQGHKLPADHTIPLNKIRKANNDKTKFKGKR